MDNQWKKRVRREASEHHMCAENRSALEKVKDKSEAIALYKKTINWALEENYPSIGVIREDFSDCEGDGIFIDKHFDGDILIDHQVYVFHNCTGSIRVGLNLKKRIIPMLYFANGCEMQVSGIPESAMPVRVPLYIFGKNKVLSEQSDDIYCVTYKFDVK